MEEKQEMLFKKCSLQGSSLASKEDAKLELKYWAKWAAHSSLALSAYYSNQSDSSISSISSREGPPRCELLFSPLEKIDLLYHPKSWKFSLKVKILSNKAYAKQLWSDLMYC